MRGASVVYFIASGLQLHCMNFVDLSTLTRPERAERRNRLDAMRILAATYSSTRALMKMNINVYNLAFDRRNLF